MTIKGLCCSAVTDGNTHVMVGLMYSPDRFIGFVGRRRTMDTRRACDKGISSSCSTERRRLVYLSLQKPDSQKLSLPHSPRSLSVSAYLIEIKG